MEDIIWLLNWLIQIMNNYPLVNIVCGVAILMRVVWEDIDAEEQVK